MPQLLVPVRDLLACATDILHELGTPTPQAQEVAESLVEANKVGHESHGVVRLLEYASFVERGVLDPAATPRVVHRSGAATVVDGNHGWGQIAARFTADQAAQAAHEYGVGIATLRNGNHIGRIGEYVERMAAGGIASIIWCNADPTVAPFGGKERMLGTNPFATGIPVEDEHPFVMDIATATVAEGKLRVARAAGATIEPGAVIDADGRDSTDPNDFYEGGALRAFGGHKGYALSAFIELLGGALSGNHPSVTSRYREGNGVVMIGIDPGAFAAADFAIDVRETVHALRDSAPARPGTNVLIPGDIEASLRSERSAEVPVNDNIWADVVALRERLAA